MKFQKIYFLAMTFIFLSGCIQSTALLGPGVTLAHNWKCYASWFPIWGKHSN